MVAPAVEVIAEQALDGCRGAEGVVAEADSQQVASHGGEMGQGIVAVAAQVAVGGFQGGGAEGPFVGGAGRQVFVPAQAAGREVAKQGG